MNKPPPEQHVPWFVPVTDGAKATVFVGMLCTFVLVGWVSYLAKGASDTWAETQLRMHNAEQLASSPEYREWLTEERRITRQSVDEAIMAIGRGDLGNFDRQSLENIALAALKTSP